MLTTSIIYNGTIISTSSEETPVNVIYKGETVASLNAGQSKTLKCANKLILEDIHIGSKTLKCAGKFFSDDVVVSVSNKISLVIPTIPDVGYTGSVIEPHIIGYNSYLMTKSGSTSASSVGDYVMTFTLNDTSNCEWEDGTTAPKNITWHLTKMPIAIPTVSGSYTYDGTVKTAGISGYNSNYMTQGGEPTATNAGEHIVTWNLKDTTNTMWSNGSSDEKSGTWYIAKRSVSIPDVSGSFTFDNAPHSASITLFDSTWSTQTGETSGTNAETYSLTYALKDKNNTTWSDNTTNDITKYWTIAVRQVSIPTLSGTYTYNGNPQTAQFNRETAYCREASGSVTTGTDAGSYDSKWELTYGSSNTVWADSSTGVQTVSWAIGKANGYLTLQTTGTQSISNGGTGTNTVTTNHGGALSVSNEGSNYCSVDISGTTITVTHKGNTGTSARTVTITVTCAETSNYFEASTTYKVSLAKSSCVTGDTLVLLGDGVSTKQIKHIKLGDSVMTWNLTEGRYEPQPVSVVYDENYAICLRTLHLHFDNGSTVKIAGQHGFFDYTLNKYVYIEEENYREFIGHEFVTYGDDNYGLAILTGANIVDNKREEIWSLQTAYNENFVTEGILSITQEFKPGRYDYFDFGEGVKWDVEKMQEDIETYGVFTYDEWKDFLEEEDFYAFNGPWFKILIGKGILTLEDIPNMISVTPSLVDEEE